MGTFDSVTFGETTIAANKTLSLNVETDNAVEWKSLLSGAGSVRKTGNGTLVISGEKTYSGDTVVEEGVFDLASNSILSSKVIIGENAMLTFGADSTVAGLDISGKTMVDLDNLSLTSTDDVVFNTGAIIDLLPYEITSSTASYILMSVEDGKAFTYQGGDWESLLASDLRHYFNLGVYGNNLVLSVNSVAVPEPASWLLLILGALGLLWFRNRKG